MIDAAQHMSYSMKRFEICRKCASSEEDGFKCKHVPGCCFGRWRTNPANDCPLGKWPKIEQPKQHEE